MRLERRRDGGIASILLSWPLDRVAGSSQPFASLFHDEDADDGVHVLRAREAPIVGIDGAEREHGSGLLIRHLLTRSGGALFEVYVLDFESGATRHSEDMSRASSNI